MNEEKKPTMQRARRESIPVRNSMYARLSGEEFGASKVTES